MRTGRLSIRMTWHKIVHSIQAVYDIPKRSQASVSVSTCWHPWYLHRLPTPLMRCWILPQTAIVKADLGSHFVWILTNREVHNGLWRQQHQATLSQARRNEKLGSFETFSLWHVSFCAKCACRLRHQREAEGVRWSVDTGEGQGGKQLWSCGCCFVDCVDCGWMNGWRRCHGLFFRFVESDLQGFFIPLVLGRIQFPQLLCSSTCQGVMGFVWVNAWMREWVLVVHILLLLTDECLCFYSCWCPIDKSVQWSKTKNCD